MAQVRERGVYKFATPVKGCVVLPWHFRNELGHYGCLDLRPCYDSGHFCISRWMYPDGGDKGFLDDPQEPVRYSEFDEFSPASWESRMHPWEDAKDGENGHSDVRFFGYDKKKAKEYVTFMVCDAIDSRKFDRVNAIRIPFGGKPMICGIKDGKVTIL